MKEVPFLALGLILTVVTTFIVSIEFMKGNEDSFVHFFAIWYAVLVFVFIGIAAKRQQKQLWWSRSFVIGLQLSCFGMALTHFVERMTGIDQNKLSSGYPYIAVVIIFFGFVGYLIREHNAHRSESN